MLSAAWLVQSRLHPVMSAVQDNLRLPQLLAVAAVLLTIPCIYVSCFSCYPHPPAASFPSSFLPQPPAISTLPATPCHPNHITITAYGQAVDPRKGPPILIKPGQTQKLTCCCTVGCTLFVCNHRSIWPSC